MKKLEKLGLEKRWWKVLNPTFPPAYFLFIYWYGVTFLSFSPFEAQEMENFPLLRILFHWITSLSYKLEVPPIYALRFIPLLFSIGSYTLFTLIVRRHFYRERELFYISALFLLLPGTILSTLLYEKGGILLFLTLLFIYLYLEGYKNGSYALLMVFAFVDTAFLSLFVGVFFYGIFKKEYTLSIVGFGVTLINLIYFNYSVGGIPRGHFADLLLVYSAIYSPLPFLYFLYALVKEFSPGEKRSIISFIALSAFSISLLFSFRQKVKIDDYAPFTLPFILHMVRHFLNSYRVRLKPFRWGYRTLFIVIFSSLIIFDILLFLNPLRERVGAGYYFTAQLAEKLKKRYPVLECKTSSSLCKALSFYQVEFEPGSPCTLTYRKRDLKVEVRCSDGERQTIDLKKLIWEPQTCFFKK
ncbi:MAG: hypothetical protein C6I01_00050 [Epsilonproteobacteria bacterium]|jgi:hypothetical protein|nr:hypothetical protein [Campylobacterota bacterium]NPA89130.1 hypothetical protein [Campylobacterota bacterium]